MNDDIVTYFDNFGVELIPKETKNFIGNKNITRKIFRIQTYNSIMCKFIDFMIKSCLIIPVYFLLMNMKRMIKL